jgi:vacuolar-type H+-ATPase subunit E/Vma4
MAACVLPSDVSLKDQQGGGAPGAAATVKRLLEAETQAQDILKAAELRVHEAVDNARTQAATLVKNARLDSAQRARVRLEDARLAAEAEIARRTSQAVNEVRELERRANQNLLRAVEAVVQSIIGRSA